MDRLVFKFYKSYFDVGSELNDKDRLAFYDALLKKQFLGIEPILNGIQKLAYISQKHSIDLQVKGWEDKMKTTLFNNPTVGGTAGGYVHPPIQEEEKEKEKEKEEEQLKDKVKYIPEFSEFLIYAKSKEPNIKESSLRLKYDAWIEAGWKNGYDKPIKSWKSNLNNTLQFIEKNNSNNIYNGKQTTNSKPNFRNSFQTAINNNEQANVSRNEREFSQDTEYTIID